MKQRFMQSDAFPQGEVLRVDQLAIHFKIQSSTRADRLEKDRPPEGPLAVDISRIGQQIVDAPVQSAAENERSPCWIKR